MKFLDSIIQKRTELFKKGSDEPIHDVVFAINHFNGAVLDIKVYMMPYEGLRDLNNKTEVVEKIVSGIMDGSILNNFNIDISESNLILFNSFDSLNFLESCYLFHLDTGSVELKIFNLSGGIIINKQLRKKHIAPVKLGKNSLARPYYLFFDTETTGLPNNFNAPVSDFDNWPRLVQLAFLCYDEKGNEISRGDFIVKPEGFDIPLVSSKIHGITTERALKEGSSLSVVLNEFYRIVDQAETLVGHNISFDEKVVGCEFLRLKMSNSILEKKKICTMKASTNYCAINGPYGFKWPSLSELHFKIFRTNFEEAHNAMMDVIVTAKCFWELKKQKRI